MQCCFRRSCLCEATTGIGVKSVLVSDASVVSSIKFISNVREGTVSGEPEEERLPLDDDRRSDRSEWSLKLDAVEKDMVVLLIRVLLFVRLLLLLL